MAKPTFTVHPQRSDGAAYVDCEVHRATSWAVKKNTVTRVNSRTYPTAIVLSRWPTKTQAELDRDYRGRGAAPLARYRLGKRMGVRPDA